MFSSEILIKSLCVVLNTLPTRILAHYPFRDNFRIPLWLLYILVITNMFFHLAAHAFCLSFGYNVRIVDFVMIVISLVTYFLCVRAELGKLVFIYTLMSNYMMIIRGVVVFVRILLFSTFQDNDTLETLIALGISILSAPAMFAFLDILKERVLRSNAPQLWNVIWIIPAMNSLLVYLITMNQTTDTLEGLLYLLARVSLSIVFLIMYYILISSLDSLQNQIEAEEKAGQREQLLALQRIQYAHLTKQIEDTRAARHDLRQHLNLITAYLEKGDNDSLKDYIRKYGKQLPFNTWTIYSQNYIVDTMVRYYAEKAEASGISFEHQLDLPEILAVEDTDICVLLGNLLENALEACEKMTDSATFIRIHGQIVGEKALSITVDNSCQSAPILEQNFLKSTKHDGLGVGTISVSNIASLYNGLTDFKYEDGIFYASVFLNPL